MDKDIAVFMTHKEYEEYKKYVALRVSNECISIKLSYSMGMGAVGYELNIFNETETINILHKQIEELRVENQKSYNEGKQSVLSDIKFHETNKKKWGLI